MVGPVLKDDGIRKLKRAFEQRVPVVRVGVIGSDRRNDGNSNATIGLKHEMGMFDESLGIQLPVRSFLRVPIADNLDKQLEKSGAFDEAVLKELMEEGSLKVWMEKIGISAEQIVLMAFDTGGFGKWQPSNMAFKKNPQTLVETQQLRNAITMKIK